MSWTEPVDITALLFILLYSDLRYLLWDKSCRLSSNHSRMFIWPHSVVLPVACPHIAYLSLCDNHRWNWQVKHVAYSSLKHCNINGFIPRSLVCVCASQIILILLAFYGELFKPSVLLFSVHYFSMLNTQLKIKLKSWTQASHSSNNICWYAGSQDNPQSRPKWVFIQTSSQLWNKMPCRYVTYCVQYVVCIPECSYFQLVLAQNSTVLGWGSIVSRRVALYRGEVPIFGGGVSLHCYSVKCERVPELALAELQSA